MVVVLNSVDSTDTLFRVIDEYLGASYGYTPQPERRFNVIMQTWPPTRTPLNGIATWCSSAIWNNPLHFHASSANLWAKTA